MSIFSTNTTHPSVLVTGSSGFVGGAIHRVFLSHNWSVLGIGRRPFQHIAPFRKITESTYLSHDLTRPIDSLPEIRQAGQFDVVVHAAALSSPWGKRKEFIQQNVEATRLLLNYCESHGKPRFVYISSSSVYYIPQHQFNITEQTPQSVRPVNLYAESKQLAEQLVCQYSGEWCILRPRAVYGPGDTVLFPRILVAAKAGRFPLFASSDGNVVISDLIYIDNLVNYVLKAAQTSGLHDDFNLTNGKPVPIIEFLTLLFNELGIPIPHRKVSVRTAWFVAGLLELLYTLLRLRGEPPITRFGVHAFAFSKTFDITKAVQKFGLPAVSNEEGLKRFVQWFQNPNEFGDL
jgi:nucleoside-diphosphate-sugar epimerase